MNGSGDRGELKVKRLDSPENVGRGVVEMASSRGTVPGIGDLNVPETVEHSLEGDPAVGSYQGSAGA